MRQSSGYLPSAKSLEKDCSHWMEQLIQAWKQGEWPQCLSLAQKITTDFPEEGLAWKLLGSLYQQQNELTDAAEAFTQAGKLLKKDAEVFYNLANVYAQLQEHAQAIKFYRQTLKLNPAFSRAYANWAGVLKQTGQLKEAEKLLRRGLNIHQQDARVNFELATLLHEADKPLEAIQYYREAVAIEPNNAVIFFNMAVALEVLWNENEAIQAYETAIANQSDYVEAYSHLGALYLKKSNFTEAEQWLLAGYAVNSQDLSILKNLAKLSRVTQRTQAYQYYVDQILHLQEFSPEVLNSIATEMLNQYLYSEAESFCLKAFAADPNDPHIQANLALIANARAESGKACEHYEKALQQLPDSESILSNYSVSLRMVGRYSEAISCLERALDINPKFVAGYINLANVYLDMGQIDTAILLQKKALQIDPAYSMALKNLLFANSYSNTLPLNESLDYAHRYGATLMKDVTPYESWHVHSQEQRIRIGLVSADLRRHPVGYFLHQWLRAFDASQIEVCGYSTDGREDPFTHELKNLCNQWRSLAGLSDAQAAMKIREDGIHILLDLTGLTSGSRLPIFAHKPAPIQAAWLGYWGTTGLPTMDYIIADPVSIDTQVAAQFTEQVVYLPNTRMCFTAPPYDIAVNALPALATGAVTFGCFQNYSKVNDDVLSCWAEVLHALPTAKLFWQTKAFNDAQICEEALAKLEQHGIDATRCALHGLVPREAYLRNHHQIDVILDTFPFTGGTTTCEALWMGVPTVTMLGETLVARQGASFLHCVGLHDWVATNRADYVSKAILLASDLDALATLRSQLREQVMASPLMNAELFAQDFEQVLFKLWQQGSAKLEPAQFLASTPVQDAFTGEQPVWVVSATRMNEETFWRDSALGRSLKRHMRQDARLVAKVACNNTRGLSEVFNEALALAPDNALMVFIHDDVWIDENAFVQAISKGLQQYDVVGVAGNSRIQPGQPGWCFLNTKFKADDGIYLRGAVSHGQHAFGPVSVYGKPSGECQLMDGLFLAAYKNPLVQANVTFDEQFDFHFYDLDFCRSATKAGLQPGVWPIRMTHQSGGAFGSAGWHSKLQAYLKKWEPSEEAPHSDLLASIAAVFDLAVAEQQQGNLQAARALYDEILQIHSNHALSLHNLGLITWEEQQQSQALSLFKKAYELAPEEWQLLKSYLNALHATDDSAELQKVLSKALKQGEHKADLQSLIDGWDVGVDELNINQTSNIQPTTEVEAGLFSLFEQAKYAEMQQELDALLQQYPDWLNGWKMLSDVCMVLKQDAREPAKRALALNMNDAEEHCYYGLVLKAQGDLRGATEAFEQAISLKSDYAAAYNNLGVVLKDLGEVNAAIGHFKQALALQPGDAGCFSNLLFCMSHAHGFESADLLQAHLAFADLYETPLKANWQPHTNKRDLDRPLRVGMVSADFRAHSIPHFLQPLLLGLASDEQFELYAYYNHPMSDEITTKTRQYFASWKDVTALSDEELAATIRQDEIDILIDLSGHTAGNRLLTFARKPAPVQVSWLGYLNTTGLTAMDYYLADAALAPVGELDDQFTEKLVQLPVNAPFMPEATIPDIQALPALNNGYITFACFNRPSKITQAAVQLWAQLMQALPDSCMLLGGMDEADSYTHIQSWFDAAGIKSDRLEFARRGSMADYLQQYHRVDICLDTFPSNGVTTTAHALWMGVPTLCLAGNRLTSRGAMALMQHAGLSGWVAENKQAWVEQGIALCSNLANLAQTRNSMRDRLQQSLLSQPAKLAEALAEAFRLMWQRWCLQKPVTSMQISITNQIPQTPDLILDAKMQAVEIMAEANTVIDSDPINELLIHARALQAQGDIEQAVLYYSEILNVLPQHAEANHNLGFIETHTLGVEHALPRLEQAVMQEAGKEQYWVTYIDALIQLHAFKTAFNAMLAGRSYGLTESMQAVLFADTVSLIIDMLDQPGADQALLLTALISDSGLFDQVIQDNLLSMQSAREAGKTIDGCMDLSACLQFIEQFPALLEAGRLLMFIRAMVAKLMWVPELIGHKIFAPAFDALLSQIRLSTSAAVARDHKRVNMIITTEVYDFGGHTKDIIAMLNTVENPMLVITDLYGRFAQQAFYQKIASALPIDCPVIVLPPEPLLQKSRRLAGLINQSARNVFLLTHHDDVVAAVACQPQLEANYYFIHHADHNLAIGNAIPHIQHVDLFGGRKIQCHQDLNVPTQCLPTTSVDRGAKTFASQITEFATVTAGSFGKFKQDGSIALSAVIAQSLSTTMGKHYHFGEIPQLALDGIRAFLHQSGVDAGRFEYMGNVPSLWDALLEIEAHIFIGSAPIMGAKSDIEAQGAGYPLLAYKARDGARHMNVGSHAPETHYWHDLTSLVAGLQAIMAGHAALSAASRAYYEQACSMQTYQQMLADMSH